MAIVRVFSCGELGKTARWRSLSLGGVFYFSGHAMGLVFGVVVCLADGVGGSLCLLLFARSSPAPWGGGLYEAGGRRSRSAVRGSGCRCDFPCLVCLSSCHLAVPRHHRLSSCLLRCPSPLSSSSLRVLAHFVRSAAPSSRFVLSCHRLIVSLPALRQAGRGVVCLLASASWLVLGLVSPCAPALPLMFSVPPLCCLSSSSCVPCLPRGSWLVAVSPRAVSSLPVLVLACCCLPVVLLPVLRQALAGRVSARLFLVARWCGAARLFVCRVLVLRLRVGGSVSWRGGLAWVSCGRCRRVFSSLLCLVCGVVVCIYKWAACSCMIDIVEREKRLRKDFRR